MIAMVCAEHIGKSYLNLPFQVVPDACINAAPVGPDMYLFSLT